MNGDTSERELGETATAPLGENSGGCTGLKRDGNRCHAQALTGSRYCFFHDPAAAEERAAASKRGGEKTRPAVLPPGTPDFPLNNATDAGALLGRTINQLLRGELDPKIANAAGYLIGLKMKAADLGKLEQRMVALEAALKEKGPAPAILDPDDDLEVSDEDE
jgi:hypothetical protein